MAIVIVDLPTQNEVIFQFAFCMFTIGYVAYIFPIFFLNFPSIFPIFPYSSLYFPMVSRGCLPSSRCPSSVPGLHGRRGRQRGGRGTLGAHPAMVAALPAERWGFHGIAKHFLGFPDVFHFLHGKSTTWGIYGEYV